MQTGAVYQHKRGSAGNRANGRAAGSGANADHAHIRRGNAGNRTSGRAAGSGANAHYARTGRANEARIRSRWRQRRRRPSRKQSP